VTRIKEESPFISKGIKHTKIEVKYKMPTHLTSTILPVCGRVSV